VGGDVQYGLSPRSSLSAGITYANVYFPDGQFGNTHHFSVRSGYNRNWTARDTVGVVYTFSEVRGSGDSFSDLNTHSVQLAYARRVTGRLTWSVTGGPEFRRQDLLDDTSLSWTAGMTLQYLHGKNAANFSYNHGTTAAAGVGATKTDSLQLGYTRMIARIWSVSANGSLFRNGQLLGSTEYRSGSAGLLVRRDIGRHASVNFNYQYQRQISDGACAGLLCTGFTRHVFAFGFSWKPEAWILH
jgi:hypothetical protein